MLAIIKKFVDYKYVSAFITLALVMYAGIAKPTLPDWMGKLFDNMFFRVGILSLVAYMNTKDAQVAIIAAVVFMVIMNKLSEKKVVESFMSEMFENEESDMSEDESDDLEESDDEEAPME